MTDCVSLAVLVLCPCAHGVLFNVHAKTIPRQPRIKSEKQKRDRRTGKNAAHCTQHGLQAAMPALHVCVCLSVKQAALSVVANFRDDVAG